VPSSLYTTSSKLTWHAIISKVLQHNPLFLDFLQEAGVSRALAVQPSNHQYDHRNYVW
jgi:hypothetical protein